jgi:hypothetical protein
LQILQQQQKFNATRKKTTHCPNYASKEGLQKWCPLPSPASAKSAIKKQCDIGSHDSTPAKFLAKATDWERNRECCEERDGSFNALRGKRSSKPVIVNNKDVQEACEQNFTHVLRHALLVSKYHTR